MIMVICSRTIFPLRFMACRAVDFLDIRAFARCAIMSQREIASRMFYD